MCLLFDERGDAGLGVLEVVCFTVCEGGGEELFRDIDSDVDVVCVHIVFSYLLFAHMLDALDAAQAASRKHPSRGVAAKLSNADKLLLLLMYDREYRTQLLELAIPEEVYYIAI
jgi:hypothetical protein